MILKNIFLVFIFSQITYATEKNLASFVQLSERTALLEFELSSTKLGWARMLPYFLTNEYKSKVNFNFDAINTPAKYYGQSAVYLKKLKNENKKLVFLEGYFSKRENQIITQNINSNLKKLKVQRTDFSADKLKSVLSDFHDNKLSIFPAALDEILGIEYDNLESKLNKADYTVDANIDTLKNWSQSNYSDIRILFHYLKLGNTDVFYDLGSGYGRVVVYGGILNPMSSFKGVELVAERVAQAKTLTAQLNLKNVMFVANDVLEESLDDGTVFYIYTAFPSIMNLVMTKLKLIAKRHPIKIVTMGESTRDIKNADWLELEKNLRPGNIGFPFQVYKSKL